MSTVWPNAAVIPAPTSIERANKTIRVTCLIGLERSVLLVDDGEVLDVAGADLESLAADDVPRQVAVRRLDVRLDPGDRGEHPEGGIRDGEDVSCGGTSRCDLVHDDGARDEGLDDSAERRGLLDLRDRVRQGGARGDDGPRAVHTL